MMPLPVCLCMGYGTAHTAHTLRTHCMVVHTSVRTLYAILYTMDNVIMVQFITV